VNAAQRSGGTDEVQLVRRPWSHRPLGLFSLDLALASLPVFALAASLASALGVLLLPSEKTGLVLPVAGIFGLLAVAGLAVIYQRAIREAYARQWASVRGREGYLVEEPWPEPDLSDRLLKSQILREGNASSAIPSVLPTAEETAFYSLVKWPIALPRIARTYGLHLPWWALRGLFHKATRGTWATDITDEQILGFIEGSSGIIFSELLEDGRTLVMRLPEQLPLETWDGRRIAGFELHVDTVDRKITRCTIEGASILGDNDQIFSIASMALTHWQHTKSHLMAEQAVLEVQRRGLEALAPSARFTLPLHDGLMNGPRSPLKGREVNWVATSVMRDSAKASLAVDIEHFIDDRKVRFRFYDFLARSRVLFIQLARKHQLDVSFEAAFNNIVVHPVDHAQCHRLMKGMMWSIDRSGRFESYLRARFFAEVMSGPLTNPLCPEQLRDLDPEAHPFYAELYAGLREIDPQLADDALTSCSF
jgi:hypothetical protein